MSTKFRRSNNSISNVVRTNPITTPLKLNRNARPILGSLSSELDRLDEADAAGDRRLDASLAASNRRTEAVFAKFEKGWADRVNAEAMKKKEDVEYASYMCKVFGLCAVGLGAAAAAASHFGKGGTRKRSTRRHGGAYKKKRTMRRRRH